MQFLRHTPISTIQARWLAYELACPHDAASSVVIEARARESIDEEALLLALHDVQARHEMLRTVFDLDRLDQIILEHPSAPSVSNSRPENLSFDLASGPLWCAWLDNTGEGPIVGIACHHIGADGLAAGHLMRDLGLAYGFRRQARVPRWPTTRSTYADFVLWERELQQDPVLPPFAELCSRLAGLRPLDLSLGPVLRGVERDLSPSLLSEAWRSAASRRVPTSAIELAAFARAISGVICAETVVLGVVMPGRTDRRFTDTVGCFAAPIPCAIEIGDDVVTTLENAGEALRLCRLLQNGPIDIWLQTLRAPVPRLNVLFARQHWFPDVVVNGTQGWKCERPLAPSPSLCAASLQTWPAAGEQPGRLLLHSRLSADIERLASSTVSGIEQIIGQLLGP